MSSISLSNQRVRGWHVFLTTLPIGLYWLVNGLLASKLSAASLVITELLILVGGGGAILFLLRRKHGVSYAELGLSPYGSWRRFIEDSVVCVIATLSVAWVAFTLAWSMVWPVDWVQASSSRWYDALFNAFGRLPVAFYFAVVAAFTEEIYFRGICRVVAFSIVQGKFAALAYCLVSAAWFGLGHWEGGLTSMIGSTILGILLARLYLWTNNLWPLIVAHFVQDLVGFGFA